MPTVSLHWLWTRIRQHPLLFGWLLLVALEPSPLWASEQAQIGQASHGATNLAAVQAQDCARQRQ